MRLPFPYVPERDDLFLYRDETITWNSGASSGTYKTPYAWNPNSRLYGYRGSLEGLQASRRTLSSGPFATLEGSPYLAFWPYVPGVRDPYFWNSYPPGGFIFHPTLSMHCAHCFSLVTPVNYPGTDSSFRGRYGVDNYLGAVQLFRYIDKDNNIFEYSDIGPLWNTISGQYVACENHKTWKSKTSLGVLTSHARTRGSDFAYATLPSAFPYTPILLATPDYLGEGSKIWVVDCNRKICDGYEARNFYVSDISIKSTTNGITLASDGSYELSDSVDQHDSGNLFFVEISPPTSPEAGDGVLAFFGHLEYSGTKAYKNLPRYEYTLGDYRGNFVGPQTFRSYSHTEMLGPTDLSNLASIGYSGALTFVDHPATGRVVATENKALEVKNLTQEFLTKLTTANDTILS